MLSRVERVAALLREDATRDLAGLRVRDRELAETGSFAKEPPHRQILRWAMARDPSLGSEPEDYPGLALLLFLAGLLLGVLACAGVLYFEGSGRVNVATVLGFLVGLQLLSVLLTVAGMLPGGLARTLGLRRPLQALALLSPSSAAVNTLRRLSPVAAEALAVLGADARRDVRLHARLRRWLLARLSQAFGIAFNLGAIACFLLLVVFTDLAFGWSTTLEVGPEPVSRLLQTLAVPWGWAVPGAVPDVELVSATRYFRAQPLPQVDVTLLGRWWPFVLGCLLTYGLLPRLLLWGLAAARQRAALRWTLNHLPGAQELLYRLNEPVVSTRATDVEAAGVPAAASRAEVSVAPTDGACALVAWGDLGLDEAELATQIRRACGLDVVESHPAAGRRTPAQDQAVLQQLAGSRRPVVIAVKSWEPPLADLLDFLEALRAASDEARAFVVVPLPAPGSAGPRGEDVDVWRARLSHLGDPWLGIRAVVEEGGS